MKLITKIMKRIILAFSIIYTLDIVFQNSNVFIPINIQTLAIGVILGPLGVVSLILIKFLI